MRFRLKGNSDIQSLFRRIDYPFKDNSLILNALTHRSLGIQNNERLEFLGDSVLNFVIAEALFNHYPDSSEGELSRLRSFLVKGETLAELSRELNLGNYIQLGQGELKSGGFRRESILADCFEAMIAAIFLDSGFDECRRVILNIYDSRIKDKYIFNHLKDPKTLLQEYLQGNKIALPDYELIAITGKQHNQQFEVQCEVKAKSLKALGKGTTRRKAEKAAAQNMLQMLKQK